MGRTFQLHEIQLRSIFTAVCICALVLTTGCSHNKTNRGYLFRADWAFEYNRTPWIGCPPDSGCGDEDGDSCCKGKDTSKGFRRHCGLSSNCTAKKPCCKTLGCGMWIDPSSPNSFAALNSPKACGLTPFCSPMKPCGLTPNCGKMPMMNPQLISTGNYEQGMMLPGMNGDFNRRIVVPTPMMPKDANQNGTVPNSTVPNNMMPKPATLAGPTGALISMGIVPGVSTLNSGGLVAAVGVRTPAGMMTPAGVQLPNGTFNNAVVLRACGLTSNCNAGHPCGMTPNCGGLVPLAAVSNNAVALASALSSPNAQSGGIINAGGGTIPVGGNINAMLANPISGQPAYGLSMNGIPQAGYPPIGYTPSGYSPKYPRFDGLGIGMSPEQYAQLQGINGEEEETEEPEPPVDSPVTKSQMPVPRFHPVPSKPAFQRSEGLPVSRKTAAMESGNDRINQSETVQAVSEEELKRAYLEGMSAAMEEIESELTAQEELQIRNRKMAEAQAKVLRQAEELQDKIQSRSDEMLAENETNKPVPQVVPQRNADVKVSAVKAETNSTSAPSLAGQNVSSNPVVKQTGNNVLSSNVLSSTAGYINGFTGKVQQGIGNIASLGKKSTVSSNDQMLQLKNAQQRILQQQAVLQKQPPKPATISRTKIQDENEIMQAGYAEP